MMITSTKPPQPRMESATAACTNASNRRTRTMWHIGPITPHSSPTPRTFPNVQCWECISCLLMKYHTTTSLKCCNFGVFSNPNVADNTLHSRWHQLQTPKLAQAKINCFIPMSICWMASWEDSDKYIDKHYIQCVLPPDQTNMLRGSFQGSLSFSFLHSLPVEMPHNTTPPLKITPGVIQPWSISITIQQPIHPILASHPSPNSPNPWANFQIQMCHIRPTSDSTVSEYKLDHLYYLLCTYVKLLNGYLRGFWQMYLTYITYIACFLMVKQTC
jgi:hypothetical protein